MNEDILFKLSIDLINKDISGKKNIYFNHD